MSNIFFVSDLHISHKNIVKSCSDWKDKNSCRDFASIEEHDDYLIEQLNKRIKSSDTLYHLGDVGLGFAWKDKIIEIRNKIKCETIHLILGNHDHQIENAQRVVKQYEEYHRNNIVATIINESEHEKYLKSKNITNLFKSINYLKFGKIGGHPIVLCHYAMRVWPWSHQGSYHLFGHSHGNLLDDNGRPIHENPDYLMLDVGIDTCAFGHEKYTPYSFEEVDSIMKTYKNPIRKKVDHH